MGYLIMVKKTKLVSLKMSKIVIRILLGRMILKYNWV